VSRVEGDAPHEGRTQIGKAIILIVVTAVIAVLVLHHVGSSGAASSPTTATSTTTTVPHTGKATRKAPTKTLLPPSKVTVQVLNGLLTGSLATNLSNTLKSGSGYETLPPNNTSTETSTSVIYVVSRGYLPEAKVLAATLGLTDKSIHRGLPTSAPMPSGVPGRANLVVVIGTSLQAKAGT
jgi:LytR cell envelope-related transcriptional attenuator